MENFDQFCGSSRLQPPQAEPSQVILEPQLNQPLHEPQLNQPLHVEPQLNQPLNEPQLNQPLHVEPLVIESPLKRP